MSERPQPYWNERKFEPALAERLQQVLVRMRNVSEIEKTEDAHAEADDLLVRLCNELGALADNGMRRTVGDILDQYASIEKWYE